MSQVFFLVLFSVFNYRALRITQFLYFLVVVCIDIHLKYKLYVHQLACCENFIYVCIFSVLLPRTDGLPKDYSTLWIIYWKQSLILPNDLPFFEPIDVLSSAGKLRPG